MNNQLEGKLNIVECDIVGSQLSEIKSKLKQSTDRSIDVENDYDSVRDNLGKLLEQGNTAVESVLQVAMESSHPRAFEVVSTMIKTTADVAEQLITLQEKMKKLTEKSDKEKDKDQHNHLHVEMTNEQLNKLLNERN